MVDKIENIRAVYERGQLRLLDAVDLDEGQAVTVQIIPSPASEVLQQLGQHVVEMDIPIETDESDEALLRRIEAGWQGDEPLSQTIIEERRSGL